MNAIREKISEIELEKSEGNKGKMFKEIIKKLHKIHKEMEMLLSYMEKESEKYDISWDMPALPKKCPFCGENLQESKKAETIEEAFKIIVTRHGKYIFAEAKKFVELLEYYAPDLDKERNLVKVAVETGAYKAMYEAGGNLEQIVDKLIADNVVQMNKKYFIDESWAKKALEWCYDVLKSETVSTQLVAEEERTLSQKIFSTKENDYGNKIDETPISEMSISNGKLIKYNGKRAVVVIPEGVREIYSRAFYANDKVKAVMLSKSVTIIGEKSFAYCSNLEEITFSESLKEIKSCAFEGCQELKEVLISEHTVVSPDAFERNTTQKRNIKKDLCEPLKRRGSIQKSEWKIEGNGWSLDSNQVLTVKKMDYTETFEQKMRRKAQWDGVKKLVLCEGITKIEREFFSQMKNLEEIVFPKTLKKIAYASFTNCEKLNSIKVPEGVTTIDARAFENCRNLKNVELPSTMKYIGDYAFANCRLLPRTLVSWGCVICPGNYNIYVGR